MNTFQKIEISVIQHALRPVLHLIERITGLSPYDLSRIAANLMRMASFFLFALVLLKVPGVKDSAFALVSYVLLSLFQFAYSESIIQKIRWREQIYMTRKIVTEEGTSVVLDPSRARWLIFSAVLTIAFWDIQKAPWGSVDWILAAPMLVMLFVYPILAVCAVTPHFKPTEKDNLEKWARIVDTFLVFGVLILITTNIALAEGSMNTGTIALLFIVYTTIATFIRELINPKRRARQEKGDHSEEDE